MAQSDNKEENLSALSGSIITNLCSHFGNIPTTYTGEQLSAEFPTEENDSAQDSGSLDESDESLNQHEDNSCTMDISSAIRAVASQGTWNLAKILSVHKLLSVSGCDDEDEDMRNADGEGEPDEGQWSLSFQSKYIQFFPLYQDYCLQSMKDDLHRLNKSFLSELITPQTLLFSLGPRSHSETSSPQCHPAEARPASPSTHPIRVTPCTLWQELDEVKESGLLSTLTAREIRLQESMFELIGSEASYLRSLGVAVNHFYASKALKQTLSQMEHHFLFSNIRPIMAAAEKFLMDLETRLGECVFIFQVGDIVLQHASAFHNLYVPYVTNMMYQENLVNQLLRQNRDFVFSLKKLESDPVCQRQGLKSFLVLPFQRITRVKLLLENILKLTEPDTDSISNLEKAIEAIHEIVTDCNKGVQKMKQIEELVCLEALLDFNKVKSVPLIVSGRFLVHQGPMRQLTVEGTYNSRTSLINVYLHLFNDLLIISSKRDQRFIVLDHTEFPAHVRIEHLKPEVLNLPSDSFLLHLSQSQVGHPTAMIFVTFTRSDKEAWMKLLSNK